MFNLEFADNILHVCTYGVVVVYISVKSLNACGHGKKKIKKQKAAKSNIHYK